MLIRLLSLTCMLLMTACARFPLVEDGTPRAEIIVADDAISSVRFAAEEIQSHLEQMSGARLPIVGKPTASDRSRIYLGAALGVSAKDLPVEGFRIRTIGDAIVIVGHDQQRPRLPYGSNTRDRQAQEDTLTAWREHTGESEWGMRAITSWRNVDPELGFASDDATATLYGAYAFLEELGVRWYMPHDELGTVIPQQNTVDLPVLDIERVPAFPIRIFHSSWGINGQLPWVKRQGLGCSYIYVCNHYLNTFLTPEMAAKHPEYVATVDGELDTDGCIGYARPKLTSPELRADATRYVRHMFDFVPEVDMFSMGMPDGFGFIDDADAAAGWDQGAERGWYGKMSNYVWDFHQHIADAVAESHPEKMLTYLAYHSYLKPPTTVDKLPTNTHVVMLNHLGHDGPLPHKWNEQAAIRQQWVDMLTGGKLYIWDHYLFHANMRYPRIPPIFTKLMQEDTQYLHEVGAHGKFIEVTLKDPGKDNRVGLPALNHLIYYLQAKLLWDPDLDREALLDEYYRLFYGPAHAEVKTFFTFAEDVWMRPESRSISYNKGFLTQADVARFFELLTAAKARTPEGNLYHRRIELLEEEMAPLHDLFDGLKRSGPQFYGRRTRADETVAPTMSSDFWTEKLPRYTMVDFTTGQPVPDLKSTEVAFRRTPDALIVGVLCREPKMEAIVAKTKDHDDPGIFDDDVVEIYVETPARSYFKIVVNANGAVFDECTDTEIAARETKTVMWTPGLEAQITRTADAWHAIITIPTDDFGEGPSNVAPWGVNVCRTRFASGEMEAFALAPTGGQPYRTLSKMGNLIAR